MQTKEYRTTDKSAWPRGPWDDEPDKIQWRDEATGLPCLIVRAHLSGSLCGYVGVPPAHPWHGKGFSDSVGACTEECAEGSHDSHSIQSLICVHGGLTYSDRCQPQGDEGHSICHVTEPGEPDDVHWFGFDCSHCWDLAPRMAMLVPFLRDGIYRDLAYVRSEVTHLAAQLAKLSESKP